MDSLKGSLPYVRDSEARSHSPVKFITDRIVRPYLSQWHRK